MTWDTIVGLEVHVELATTSKIFCGCPTLFGRPPNTQCCPVCSGFPGALPVLNQQVIEYALRVCLATDCTINSLIRFDRKNYFYPDLPKGYQISQQHQPIGRGGKLVITTDNGDKAIGIHEIHIEEDAGKLIHDPQGKHTLVDYNRCGIPLLEIISRPDLNSAEEALDYLDKLRRLLLFIGVSDCRMEEGSLRADVNVSVRPTGSKVLGTRTELKNMSSMKAMALAIAYESRRQIKILTEGGRIRQETRRWDENEKRSFALRIKENVEDYRYFPDPDLMAIRIDDHWIKNTRELLPELPDAKYQRYLTTLDLTAYEASILTSHPALADLFEATVAICGRAKDVAGWIMGEWLQECNQRACRPQDLKVTPEKLARLVRLLAEGDITRGTARQVFIQMIDNQADPDDYVHRHNLRMIRDIKTIDAAIDQAMAAHPRSVADYRAGKNKVRTFLVGQAMRVLQGKADPALLNRRLLEKLNTPD
jgi:aspartyl-tRNA(Asn)/glutamyl-tRNA(Gln) amidotransferase subunit B